VAAPGGDILKKRVSLSRKKLFVLAPLVAAAAGGLTWYGLTERQFYAPEQLLRRLPVDDAILVGVDFAALRAAGVLAKLTGVASLESEYRDFVAQTGFDYQRDLDGALLSFHPRGVYLLARGRFAWNQLEAYAQSQGGACFNRLCRLPGSRPERRISFFPLRRGLMALAVSEDGYAATRLNQPAAPAPFAVPGDPVWIHLTAGALREPTRFPEGTRLFIKALDIAEGVTLTLGAGGAGAFELRMEAPCRSAREAETLRGTLEKITSLLQALIRREGQQASEADLSGVLTSGEFTLQDRTVRGRWRLPPQFVAQLMQ